MTGLGMLFTTGDAIKRTVFEKQSVTSSTSYNE